MNIVNLWFSRCANFLRLHLMEASIECFRRNKRDRILLDLLYDQKRSRISEWATIDLGWSHRRIIMISVALIKNYSAWSKCRPCRWRPVRPHHLAPSSRRHWSKGDVLLALVPYLNNSSYGRRDRIIKIDKPYLRIFSVIVCTDKKTSAVPRAKMHLLLTISAGLAVGWWHWISYLL